MRTIKKTTLMRMSASAGALAAALVLSTAAQAQTSTSRIEGLVAGSPGVEVVARNVDTGFTSRDTTNASGQYSLLGLQPGTYEVTVTTADGQQQSQTVRVLLGETATVDLGDVPEEETAVEAVVVTARRAVQEVATSEIATSVTQEQIQSLPQINRNFLNFAALAPGVRVSQSETEQTITAGGQRAESVNAFIDGASLKSNIIDGGISGQDDSRGNPFPQGAVQEFRVLTQNFSAQYEQASSAIITAVTRSGTNRFEGEVFGTYRDESFIAQDEFAERRGDEKPDLTVKQYGFTFGGPIIRDKLHFFTSYERKEEGRAAVVNLGRQDPRFVTRFGEFIGTFPVPFEEDLLFGKISWQPNEANRVDLSATYRDEFDTRGIGGADTVQRANRLNQKTTTVNFRHQYRAETFLNEFSVDYKDYNFNPEAVNFSDFGQTYRLFEQDQNSTLPGFQPDFFGGAAIINLGGSDSRQDISDKVLTFRNDITFDDLQFRGSHTVRAGAKFSTQNYQVNKEFGRNPVFFFDVDGRPETSGSLTVPYRVELGNEFPDVDLTNNVYGLYIQDDWQVTDQLEVNLGLRWDYEDNANNAEYVTPPEVRQGVANLPFRPSFFNVNDYISDGDREPFAKAFQPRIGFSYDVFDDRRTVVFGGAGRYYDRVQFNFSFDEIVKPFDFRQNLFFSTTGRAPGVATGDAGDPILFRPEYLTTAGLDALLANVAARGEVFLLKNEFEPPRTDQFNLGVRQRVGIFQTEFTLAYGKTENEFTWLYLNRCAEPTRPSTDGGFGDNGGFCGPSSAQSPRFRSYLASDHNKEREFKALYVKIDKYYTEASGWGLNIAYTLSESKQNGGNDNFCFDCFDIVGSPVRPSGNDERHRIVANGIVDIPYGFQLSGLLTLGTGVPYDVFDGRGANFTYRPNAGRPDSELLGFAYRNLDLRLTKGFELPRGTEVEFFVDAINVFNFSNFSGFDGGTGSATDPNENFGQPSTVLFPTRSFQLGARFRF